MKRKHSTKSFFGTELPAVHSSLFLICALCALPVQAAPYNISSVPLYLGGTIEPNLMYIHDDSGSMYWSFMPDGIVRNSSTKRAKSAAYNNVYYDPSVIYYPPLDENGNSLGSASFTAAWFDGYSSSRSSNTVNLSTRFRPTWYYSNSNDAPEYAGSSEAAYYYVFNSSNHNCNGTVNDDDCYTKVIVGSSSGSGTVDLNGDSAITAADKDERTNFANWYSYYRTRNYAAKAGVSRAFSTLGTGIRVGYGRINKSSMVERGVREFSGTDRENFFDWLWDVEPTGNTPLRRALDAAGQYFESSSDNPWSTTPGQSGGTDLSCRQSYTIMMTDGYWNSSSASTNAARTNNDGTAGSTIAGPSGESYTYSAVSPFTDTYNDTLADVAMYYWKRDLQPSLENRVPTSVLDPAFWQHMVTFGIGLGVEGTIDSTNAFNAISSGASITWPNGSSSQIDDLLHASVNGRGGFYSAQNPNQFAAALSATLAAIGQRTSTAAAVAASSFQLQTDSLVFRAEYESGGWSGKLYAYSLDTSGNPVSPALWEAGSLLPAASARNIVTWRPDLTIPAGTNFLWANLSSTQKTLIDSASVSNTSSPVMNWLRGDTVTGLRTRTSRLGDIINSDPAFVGQDDFGYSTASSLTLAQRQAYATRASSAAYLSRPKMLYVGANDGMLHGFQGTTGASGGAEKLAYVPNAVIANLSQLSETTYQHKYFVDGPPKVGDAWIGASATSGDWKSVLVGSTGAGGRAYFALDVESPTTFGPGNVMWEFTHNELGTAIGQASIVRTESGDWVAIFGNGYNSNSHKAQLFVVNIRTGALIRAIDTGVGSYATPNGLGTPVAVDYDKDGAADMVYAGDMQGNLWKFDFTSSASTGWKVAFMNGTTPKPLFKARDSLGNAQPITAKPQVASFSGSGTYVYVGTGKFFEVGDQGDLSRQTFYGVKDECGNDVSTTCTTASGDAKVLRSNLLQQTIVSETSVTIDGTTSTVRVLSANDLLTTHKGFLIDLVSPVLGAQGERITDTVEVWSDRVIFVTRIPSADPCAFGGDSWLMEVDPLGGGRLTFSPFDLNGDSNFNSSDYVNIGTANVPKYVPVSGVKKVGGMLRTPAIVRVGTDKVNKIMSDTSGNFVTIPNKVPYTLGRQSWRQIR